MRSCKTKSRKRATGVWCSAIRKNNHHHPHELSPPYFNIKCLEPRSTSEKQIIPSFFWLQQLFTLLCVGKVSEAIFCCFTQLFDTGRVVEHNDFTRLTSFTIIWLSVWHLLLPAGRRRREKIVSSKPILVLREMPCSATQSTNWFDHSSLNLLTPQSARSGRSAPFSLLPRHPSRNGNEPFIFWELQLNRNKAKLLNRSVLVALVH